MSVMPNAPDAPVPAPILRDKQHDAPSVFRPENLLREARRQKGLPEIPVPPLCVLDPDGDLVRHLRQQGQARPDPRWACYHTELDRFVADDVECGIVGRAVGAPFAVLVAEELFAAGSRFLLSVTSAGQLAPARPPPYFVLIDRALRDEGTSYHYLPATEYSEAEPGLVAALLDAVVGAGIPALRGGTWTTDAPFRETAVAIAARRAAGLLAVEMEAAALYAFARARRVPLLCVAHVTNQMGQRDGDFEKGAADGAEATLGLVSAVARWWREGRRERP
jgi:uridine phosphorylase